jgi:amino acid permease
VIVIAKERASREMSVDLEESLLFAHRRSSSSLNSDGAPLLVGRVGAKGLVRGVASQFDGVRALIPNLLGSGILSAPYAIVKCGFVSGLGLLLFTTAVCWYTCHSVVRLGRREGLEAYDSLARRAFGVAGYVLVFVSALGIEFGSILSYLVAIADNVTSVATAHIDEEAHPWWHHALTTRQLVQAGAACLLILPACAMKDIRNMATASGVSVVLMFCTVGLVLYMDWSQPNHFHYDPAEFPNNTHRSPYELIHFSTLAEGLGIFSYAMICHDSVFAIASGLKDKSDASWRLISSVSFAFALVLTSLFALGGYLAFFWDTQGNVLINFDAKDAVVAISTYLVSVCVRKSCCCVCVCVVSYHHHHCVCYPLTQPKSCTPCVSATRRPCCSLRCASTY